ncbi:hypothetical protein MN608_10091 [Microdochium nivale]|nr:hypothetical protein MN608_10091 [Microdochium nivale]
MADTSTWAFWHDHTSGWSWTMTVPNQHGYYITSFLATVVVLAGASAWTIVSLLIHAHLARKGPTTDIFGLQQQVSLRNSPSGFRATLDAVLVLLSWRGKPGKRRVRRAALIAVPGIVTWGGFLVASLLTSRVATEFTDRAMVRAKPERCGFLTYTLNNQSDVAKSFTTLDEFRDLAADKWANDTVAARAYALSMQSDTTRAGRSRSVYINPKLSYTLETNLPCALPDSSYCFNNDNSTIRLTSAKLDSHNDLGINAPPADRVLFQHKAECSIMNNQPFLAEDDSFRYYSMGPVGSPNDTGATYIYSKGNWTSYVGYQLDALYAAPDSGAEGYWHPVEGIARDDANLGIIFLSQNGVTYSSPVNDTFFLARLNKPSAGNRFESDYFVRAMVCAEQLRWCNSADEPGECTDWGTASRLWEDAIGEGNRSVLGFNAAQRATAARISWDPQASVSILDSVVNLNAAALFASTKVRFNLISSGLPNNQWHKEVSGWFETALADYQATAGEYVRKSSTLDAIRVLSPFTDRDELITEHGLTDDMMPALQAQCANQLVEDTAHLQNFNVVAVIIIIAVTVALVCVSFCMVDILDFFSDLSHRRLGQTSRSKIARQADEQLHLLRHTLNGTTEGPRAWGLAPWTGVPVIVAPTDDDDEKAMMTVRDCTVQRPVMKGDDLTIYPKHADLRHSTASFESTAMLL